MAHPRKQINVSMTVALILDVAEQLREAEYYWSEFLEASTILPGDHTQTKKFRTVTDRFEKAINKALKKAGHKEVENG